MKISAILHPLEGRTIEQDDDSEINLLDTHETKAKQYISKGRTKISDCPGEAWLAYKVDKIKIQHTRVK
jgi:hypothetical protein